MGEEVDNSLHIKGQMMFMAEWNLIMFLAAPILTDLTTLEKSGLYVNDLPLHDFSRDLLLAAEQKSDSLKDALDTEQVINLGYFHQRYCFLHFVVDLLVSLAFKKRSFSSCTL